MCIRDRGPMPSSIPQNVAKFRRRWLLLRPCRNDFAKAGTVSIEIRGACSAVVLKLKTSEFSILTRSHTPRTPPSSCEELTSIALSLRELSLIHIWSGISGYDWCDERYTLITSTCRGTDSLSLFGQPILTGVRLSENQRRKRDSLAWKLV